MKNKFAHKFAEFIVKARWYLFGIFLALTIASVFLVPMVGVNYDMTKYLPENSSTKIALKVMEDEFGSAGTASVMIENASIETANELRARLELIDGVATVVFDGGNSSYYDGQNALLKVFFDKGDYAEETDKAIAEIRTACADYEIALAGSAIDATTSRGAIGNEMIIILGIAVAIVILILLLTSRSWIEPVVYLIVIGCAILMNMGTNLILGEISFITQSISAVMLIALEMDYCIVLCSRFREESEKGLPPVEAMKEALAGSLMAIIASSLTVMAGLLALTFMDFSIGFDIGMVLAKGVFISILAVLFFMPSIILMFSRAIEKTRHRSFLPKMDKVGSFAHKTRFVLPVVFLALVISGVVLQTSVNFTYVADANKDGSQAKIESAKIEENFGKQNSLVVMLPTEYVENANANYLPRKTQVSIEYERNLYNAILNIETEGEYINAKSAIIDTDLYKTVTPAEFAAMFNVDSATANAIFAQIGTDTVYMLDVINFLYNNQEMLSTVQKAVVRAYYNQAASALAMFSSSNYDRMIFNINLAVDDENAISFIKELNELISTEDNVYLANSTNNLIETEQTFKTDRIKTDLITIFAILLIVLLTFRSLSIPLILVLTIQGAIWINLGISTLAGESVFFVCYLLAMAIQMGATIDYGILLSDRYIKFRKEFSKVDALKKALNASITTILSSGLILILAAFTIHFVSSTPLLAEIGLLIGRGALISVIAVLFILPQLLLIFDKIIEKTTLKQKFFVEKKAPVLLAENNAGKSEVTAEKVEEKVVEVEAEKCDEKPTKKVEENLEENTIKSVENSNEQAEAIPEKAEETTENEPEKIEEKTNNNQKN